MNDMRILERAVEQTEIKISARDVQVWYGDKHAIKDVDVDLLDKTVTAFIGPSGCGKSTFLRCLNRMNDTIDISRVEGKITLDGEDIYDKRVDPVQLRARVGMVFQKPNPFPKSIYDNVAYGPRIHGLARQPRRTGRDRREIAARRGAVERGQGPAERSRHRPVGRPAAAALHRPRRGDPARGAVDGRALLGAGPHRHQPGRRADRPVARRGRPTCAWCCR